MATKLKATQVKPVRESFLLKQGGRCAICQRTTPHKYARLDHDHHTGAVRAVLCNGCNCLLGKLENNAARFGVSDIGLFTNGVAQYLRTHAVNVSGYIHPTHKTEDEKRLARNDKARKARAKKKESA